MKLSDYIGDMQTRRDLAESVGTIPDYLWQIASGWRGKRASKTLAIAIESATNGAVTRYDLRPDIFGEAPASEKQAA